MLRRTLLQILSALVVVRPVRALTRILQVPPFNALEVETLSAVADVVLPSDLGPVGRRRAVDRFVAWFVNYREGADRGHGYGASTLRPPSGPSPALRYPPQFAALEAAARDRGATTFAALAPAARREVIQKLLDEPRPVNRLPTQPNGANLIADFMGSYFTSAGAWDQCYRAEIRRESCRTLEDSADEPRPLEGR
jgi:Gluconate 2-dehydrogenase subunit 3